MNSLRVFEAAARHQSFVRAADELHVTHGAVSRQIKQLEAALGLALFERRNRAVFLTKAGGDLLGACSDAMHRIAEAVRKLHESVDAQEPLVVSCEPTIAMRWLIPRLPAFRERFPGHRLHLLTAGGPVDFVRDRIDVALRRNDFQWADACLAERVAPELVGPVCAPDVVATLKPGRGSARAQRLLHTRSRASAWQRWSQTYGAPMEADEHEHFEHFYLCLQAAAAGLGVGMASAYMVEEDLREGRLVAPFGFVPDGSEYVLLSREPFDDDERRLLLLDWLRHEMGMSRQARE